MIDYNLLYINRLLTEISISEPNINSVVKDFTDLNRETARYSSVIIQQQVHNRIGDYINYNFYIGYTDRLVEDESNEVEVQSVAINVIDNIVNKLKAKLKDTNIEVSVLNYNCFTQRFLALAAGAYSLVVISVPVSDCFEGDLPAIGSTWYGDNLLKIGYSDQIDCPKLSSDILYSQSKLSIDDCKGDSKLVIAPRFNTSNRVNFSGLFNRCKNLEYVSRLDTSKGRSFNSMFGNCSSLTTIPQLDTSNGTNFGQMFYKCSNLTTVPQLDTSKGTGFNSMFYSCSSLTTIPQLDTSKGTNFISMFYGCSKLTTVPQLDTSKGTDFSWMFSGCYSLTTIPQLNTSKGTNFREMFSGCTSLTTIPQLDTSKGPDFRGMCNGCYSLTTIEGIDFTNDKYPPTSQSDHNRAFGGCEKLTNLTINGVINNNKSFYGCPLSSDSIKSVLIAANKTTNTNKKNLWFEATTITDDAEGTFTTLVSECTSKGWTVIGINIINK